MSAYAMTADSFDVDDEADDGIVQSPWPRLLLGMLALVAVAAALWGFFQFTGTQQVSRIRIEGTLNHVSASEVEAAVRPLLDARFIEVDLEQIHQVAAALPWVASVRVERQWPAMVRVRVWEREPIARWGGEEILLDEKSAEFPTAGRSVPPGLPLLSGPAGSASVVMDMYRQLAGPLKGSLFELQSLSQDARGEWTALAKNGIELRFGRGDPAPALANLLGPAAQALTERIAQVHHVDLRYTNGFSVGWLEPAADKRGN
ncbi:MAG TPA: FtsQ-type POTRA domain-containing protein [Fontimonas sp.]